jgi:hypothetical protein
VNQLVEQVSRAGERGIPTESLANKVKEGLAKGIEPRRIDSVLRQMVDHYDKAQEVLKETGSRGIEEGNRQRAMETMAEALSRGATADEVRELARMSKDGRQKITQEELAAGAKGLAVMKEGKIPSKDGAALVGEGLRQGYRSSELIDLGREVKRRGSDFREGRASIQELREKVSRGEREDKLFREDRGGDGDRDRRDRGDRGGRDEGDRDRSDRSGGGDRGDRSDRIERSEKVDRAEKLDRPEKLERPEKFERPERSDNSGKGRD